MIDCSARLPGLVLPHATGIKRYPDRATWLVAARRRVGGSTVAKVLGLSPYGGPWSAWAERCLPPRPRKRETAAQRRGHREEARILEDYAAETGHTYVGPMGWVTITGPESWLGITPDALISPEPGQWELAQLKTDRSPFPWGPSGEVVEAWTADAATRIREDHAVQLYLELYVTGLEWGRLIVKRSMDDVRVYRLRRDRALEAAFLPKLRDFWHLVETKTPPPLDDSAGCAAALARIYPDMGKRVYLEPTEDDRQLLARWMVATRMQEQDTTRRRELAAQLGERLGKRGAYGWRIDSPMGPDGFTGRVQWQRIANDGRTLRTYRSKE